MKQTQKNQKIHQPVLTQAVIEYLNPKKGDKYLDVTAGYGGHAAAILNLTQSPKNSTLIDRDSEAIEYLKGKFDEKKGIEIIKGDYLSKSLGLLNKGRDYDLILADIGVSSQHLNQASRGFGFQQDGPLDMRMDQSQELIAADIVNKYKEGDLAMLLEKYGEEPKAKQIAHLIVVNRPINDTQSLANLVKKVWRGYSKVHPATRTFQALRIAVNDELNQLQQALPIWVRLLSPGGRVAIISFHSLEDRIVKHFFNDLSGNRLDAELKVLTKKAVVASPDEIVTNPRARSAKLRAAVKIKKERGSDAYPGKRSLPGV